VQDLRFDFEGEVTMKRGLVTLAGVSVFLFGCGQMTEDEPPVPGTLSFNDPIFAGDLQCSPADPYLKVAPGGDVYLSWTEQEPGNEEGGRNFFIATLSSEGELLDLPRQINERLGEVSSHGGENLAKFTIGVDGSLTGVWATRGPLAKTGDLRMAHAESAGLFPPATALNDDREKAINHAFSGIATSPDGKIYAAWNDGRNDLESSQVFMAVSEDGGKTFGSNYSIAESACPCCRPSILFLEGGKTVVVAYRIVPPDNVRNHVVIRSTDGGRTFSDPVTISDDGWVSYG
jgi:hypothetical protein